ncbi:DUF835 domain-containing protein [Natronomonas marina]|uniref:DUF835 domain-containing protein n=1 Tax=Natronomonas marina TaxID=2961939 RepID=UPI0020C99E08|nr:DUF835 domain-containing protein [Natronomonas marina]
MWGTDEPGLPESARTVLVLAPTMAGADACAALSGRGDRVLFVGYGGLTEADLRERFEERLAEAPPIRSLGVGEGVEPGDLTGQGITIEEALSPGTAVCFDSVGALLQYVDREQVFQFVHSLAERCAESSASMHFHLDPAAVDERTVSALSTLMDAVVRVEDDEVRVRPELTGKD